MLQRKEETKKRWTEYCSNLYNNTGNSDCLIAELEQITPTPTEDATQDILYEEVETAIKRLKAQKSPGTDGITSEMIQARGDIVTSEMHKICNQA